MWLNTSRETFCYKNTINEHNLTFSPNENFVFIFIIIFVFCQFLCFDPCFVFFPQTKRTPSKRKSKLEREREEAEEILKNMGASVEIEGGRRTRSSARGSAPATPPPAKKPRTATTPSTGK
jgi:Domain of unknown function (DUF4775)